METAYFKNSDGVIEKREFPPQQIKAEHIASIESLTIVTEADYNTYVEAQAQAELDQADITFDLPNALTRITGDVSTIVDNIYGQPVSAETHELIRNMIFDLKLTSTGDTDTNDAGTITTVTMYRRHWDNLGADRKAQVEQLIELYGVPSL